MSDSTFSLIYYQDIAKVPDVLRFRAIKKKCGFSAISYVNIFPANVLFKG